MTELEIMQRAKNYLDKLAQGLLIRLPTVKCRRTMLSTMCASPAVSFMRLIFCGR